MKFNHAAESYLSHRLQVYSQKVESMRQKQIAERFNHAAQSYLSHHLAMHIKLIRTMHQSGPPLNSIIQVILTWAITCLFTVIWLHDPRKLFHAENYHLSHHLSIHRKLNLCIKSRLPRISITQLNLTWCITWQCTESWFHASRVDPPLNWISQLSLSWTITCLCTESWFHASK